MRTYVDRRAIWITGNKLQVLERLTTLCHDYGPQTTVVDLLRLLRQ